MNYISDRHGYCQDGYDLKGFIHRDGSSRPYDCYGYDRRGYTRDGEYRPDFNLDALFN
jgi:hypothetical protein